MGERILTDEILVEMLWKNKVSRSWPLASCDRTLELELGQMAITARLNGLSE